MHDCIKNLYGFVNLKSTDLTLGYTIWNFIGGLKRQAETG
jgi:hypothetical protein